ncbi:kinesin light chain [Bimuria novae-zelandiae CBS 107.79]|uniref:Kinesin light chain n=1 Tax=Bimuria novae-zelandiae CBS 107.79 TaxID=1447943 RepID=A0A6A5UU30_9PLEO|nr:kinesin light chain [Bimuria novae-zelandiae CBS 107.79]
MANLAPTYRNQDRWPEAEALFMQVMETRKTKLGADHPSTLTSMNNLSVTYKHQGRWTEAEALDVQTILNLWSSQTLTSMSSLAYTLKDQGSTSRAISLIEDCCDLQTVALGPQHPYTI